MALVHGKTITQNNIVTNGLILHLDGSHPSSLGTQNFFRATNNPTNTTYWSYGGITTGAASGISLPTETIYPLYSRSVYKVSEDTSNGQHLLYQALTGTTTLGKVETISGYFKAADRNMVALTMHGEGYPVFNLSNGTVTSGGGSNTTNTIRDAGNGWYYCSSTFARTNTTRTYYIVGWNGTTNNYTGTSGSGYYYYDAQIRDSFSENAFVGNSGITELNQTLLGTTWGDLSGIMGNVNIQNRSTDWTVRIDGDTGLLGIYNGLSRTNSSTPGINIPMNNGFNRAAGTIDFWIKPMVNNVGGHGWFVNADGVSYTNASGWLWFGTWDTNEYLYARQGNPTTCCNDIAISGFSTNYYFLNSWINLSLTWDVAAGRMAVYRNGSVLSSRTDMPTNIPTTVLNATGQMFNNHTRDDNMQFKGYCNVYRIYNRELSSTEIKQNYIATSQRFK